jgi:hypothetical protein
MVLVHINDKGGVVAKNTEMVERVLDGMAEGKTLAESVAEMARAERKAGKTGAEVITAGRVRRWIAEDEAYFSLYQRMKRMLGQAFAEEALRIARESTTSTTAMDRVLIETLKWSAAKANPVEYGEKQTVEHQGSQTLSVKIVEDDAPVRNIHALNAAGKDALVGTMISGVFPHMLAIPRQKDDED